MGTEDSLKDELTGAYSRAYLYIRLNEELARAARYNSPFSILLVDLDYFKSINDAFGHLTGDRVMAEFADLLRKEVRTSDQVFRYGGDEFVILMPYTSKHKAAILAERLLQQIRLYRFGEKITLKLTMSCGVASFPEDGGTAEDLFGAADQHHYLAKRKGRDCLVSESPHLDDPRTLDEVSRLIERDEALSIVRTFIQELPGSSRSLLRLSGEPGLGITRFLQEVSKIARLSGFGVLSLRGAPALENRKYSVFVDGLVEHDIVSIQDVEKIVFSQDWLARVNTLFSQWINKKGYSGLLITLDNIPKMDRASLDILKGCFFASQDFPLGLVYADSGIKAQQLFPFGIQAQADVSLQPISLAGVQVWLRQSLRKEPPFDFVEWVAEKTRGYPALIQKYLQDLVRTGALKNSAHGLSLADNYKEDDSLNLYLSANRSPQGEIVAVPFSDLIGRHLEIHALKNLVREERLVTVSGMGGVGKSRLASQVAQESQESFTNGALYLSLAGIEDDFSIIYALAEALGLRFARKLPEREQLINYLFTKEILIVLDNIENTRMSAELITFLLENTLAVRFLVTTRERLNLRHEVVYELQGLQIPLTNELADVETYGSTQLFLHVARRGKPDFQAQEADWPPIAKICRHLSGLPLGIELAAAWLESLSCSQIAAQFEREDDSLSVFPAERKSEGHNLNFILEALWERFSQAEKELIVSMAFFRGGFSRHAAQNILGASLFFLDALVNKSILRHAGSDRYLMHELIRQQLLTHKDNEQAVYQFFNKRYATYYLEIVAGLKARVNQSQEKEALAAISLDFENMRAAWNWAVKNKVYTLIQPAVQGWFFFFEQRGRFKEGQEAFESILQQLKSDLFEDIPENLKSLTASVLGILGKFHYHLGDYQQSEAYLVRALADFKAIERPEKVAFIQYEKAILKRAQGDYQRARELLNDSLLYYQEVGDQRSQGDILNSLGVIASGLGEIELAEQYYSACLEIFQELADPGKISRALNNLGYSYLEKGDYTASLPLLEKSLEISQDISAGPLSAAVLESLGSLYFAMGDYISSTRYYRDALRLCVKLNALPLTLEILLGFSKIFSSQGEWQQALELMCLVYHHPSVVHEVRARAQQMLSACEHSQAQYCLSLNQVEITSLDVDHAISNILFPH